MAIHYYYIILTCIFTFLGFYSTPLFAFVFYWTSLSLLIVSIAYLFEKPNIFRKNTDGRVPIIIHVLLWPFISGAYLYNAIARRLDKTEKMHKVEEGLYVATRLNMHDFTSAEISGIDAIVDMTAEFSALDWGASALSLHYLNSPTLDHQAPKIQALREVITWIDNHRRNNKKVVVHCALGRGRSVFVVAAYLLAKNPKLSVRDALEKITQIRTQAGLNKRQLKRLLSYHETQKIFTYPPAWLIVNPVAGGGKWKNEKDLIIHQLYKHFTLTIKKTSTSTSAQQLTERALADNVKNIIAGGGDGTLREVAQQVVNKSINFGFVPLGTTNALAHNLYGHYAKINPVEVALSNICSKRTNQIDTATCNGETALLLAGIGLEYEMMNYANREIKDDMGQLAYLSGFWRAYSAGKVHSLEVSFDGYPFEEIKTTSFVVANAAPFTSILAQGNGSPDFQDGYLDVTWIKNETNGNDKFIGLGELISAGLRLNTHHQGQGLASRSKNISTQRVKKILIKSEQPLNYVIDGELFQRDKLAIHINPSALNVFMEK